MSVPLILVYRPGVQANLGSANVVPAVIQSESVKFVGLQSELRHTNFPWRPSAGTMPTYFYRPTQTGFYVSDVERQNLT
jgi:hypothetical protein